VQPDKVNVEWKVVPVLKHHNMKRSKGVMIMHHSFLILALDEASSQLHNPAALSLGKEPLLPIG